MRREQKKVGCNSLMKENPKFIINPFDEIPSFSRNRNQHSIKWVFCSLNSIGQEKKAAKRNSFCVKSIAQRSAAKRNLK